MPKEPASFVIFFLLFALVYEQPNEILAISLFSRCCFLFAALVLNGQSFGWRDPCSGHGSLWRTDASLRNIAESSPGCTA